MEFLRQLFRDTKHAVELRAIPSTARRFTRLPVEARRFIDQHGGENVYFGLATRDGTGSGTKENCVEVPALWVDQDFKAVPEPEAHQRLERFPIPPSITVESGGGYHSYWRLHSPVPADAGVVEPILKGLAQALGGDLAAAELARCMRLPGTLNHKYDPPRLCQIVEVIGSELTSSPTSSRLLPAAMRAVPKEQVRRDSASEYPKASATRI